MIRLASSFQPLSLRSRVSAPVATSLRCFARWDVGDPVQVEGKHKGKTRQGVVQEHRGSGWYTVILEENQETVKVRGTKLRRSIEEEGNATEATASVVREGTGKVSKGRKSSGILPLPVSKPATIASSSSAKHNSKASTTATTSNKRASASITGSGSTIPFVTAKASTIPAVSVEPFLTRSIPKRVPSDAYTSLPPPPTLYNLDAALLEVCNSSDPVQNPLDRDYLAQVEHHAMFDRWVVFTDLHCSRATLDTCLQVLDMVHQMAVKRSAGVLMLGDFWHYRGSLHVDCLNSILDALSRWTVPMVMIPGNHDQVTLAGYDHSLTPLQNAYRCGDVAGPLIFSHPTLFRNALFLPHIRHASIMESILQCKHVQDHAKAVLCHADVTGAYMNDLLVSTGGVPPSFFPADIPVYSGHFHKPHIVDTSKDRYIEYLGSPYEISLAEAEQGKALVVLDGNDWSITERIPMSVGRKHYHWDLADVTSSKCTELQPGDRVVVTVRRKEAREDQLEAAVQDLRDKEIQVEVRAAKEYPSDTSQVKGIVREAPVETWSVESTWKGYWADLVGRDVVLENVAEELQQQGLDLLQNTSDTSHVDMKQTSIQFDSVSVQGFGPFVDEVTYPLHNRGLVLLRGINRDSGGGASSNGSGKTSLVVAVLWALTGSLDPRPMVDTKVADVINDECKTARVTVQGTVNGVEFCVTRSKTKSRSSLSLLYDRTDHTTQSASETQGIIDDLLSTSLLSRTLLLSSQHVGLEGLRLEASDTSFKDELSRVIPLDVWRKAAVKARSDSKAAKKEAAVSEGMLRVRKCDAEESEALLRLAEEKLASAQTEYDAVKADLATSGNENSVSLDAIHIQRRDLRLSYASLSVERTQLNADRDHELEALLSVCNELGMSLDEALKNVSELQRDVDIKRARLEYAQSTRNSLALQWEVDLSGDALPELFELPSTCPTCHQSIHEKSDTHGHVPLHDTVQHSLQECLDAVHRALMEVQAAEAALLEATDAKTTLMEQLTAAKENHSSRQLHWSALLTELDDRLSKTRQEEDDVLEQLASISNLPTSLSPRLREAEQQLNTTRLSVERLQEQLAKLNSTITSLQGDHNRHSQRETTMSELAKAFSTKGVQSFVLQHTVDELLEKTQSYLTDLSDGSQQLDMSLESGDGIARRALVRSSNSGEFVERPLGSLSGGQWRRCQLALNFGFADLLASRGQFRSSLCVLDEPLTHLDQSGRDEVGRMLQRIIRRNGASKDTATSGLLFDNIVIILQDLAAEELEDVFDCIDEVVKKNGASTVVTDELETE